MEGSAGTAKVRQRCQQHRWISPDDPRVLGGRCWEWQGGWSSSLERLSGPERGISGTFPLVSPPHPHKRDPENIRRAVPGISGFFLLLAGVQGV